MQLENKIQRLEEEQIETLNNASVLGEFSVGLDDTVEVERGQLLRKVRDTVAVMVKLEGQLRSLSASTLSMSSSSSLGSLSTSSRGSASSLSFTDIYGGGGAGYTGYQYSSSEHVAQSVADLQRRVNKHLSTNTEQDRQYAEKLRQIQDGVAGVVMSQSTLSLSPRSSLSSLSTPTSSSCDQALLLPINDVTLEGNSDGIDSSYNITLTPSDATSDSNNVTSTLIAAAATSTTSVAASELEHIDQQLGNMRLFAEASSSNDLASSTSTTSHVAAQAGYNVTATSTSSIPMFEDDLECDDELRAVNQKLREAGLLADSGRCIIGGSSKDLYVSNESVDTAANGGGHQLFHLQSMPNLSQYLQAQTAATKSSHGSNSNLLYENVLGSKAAGVRRSLTKSVSTTLSPTTFSHTITTTETSTIFTSSASTTNNNSHQQQHHYHHGEMLPSTASGNNRHQLMLELALKNTPVNNGHGINPISGAIGGRGTVHNMIDHHNSSGGAGGLVDIVVRGSGGSDSSGGRSSMSAAVSDESVAGDSGVYEAYSISSPDGANVPQIQIKLR